MNSNLLEEFQNALDDDHERHEEAYGSHETEFYTDSDEECLDECGDV